MLFTDLLTKGFLNVAMLSITTHILLIEMGFVKCTGPQLLWVFLQNLKYYGQKGSPFIMIN